MLVTQAAQQYRPEDRQRFAEYVAQDAMAAAQLRAPMYEEKVVDFLFDKAEVTEREVTSEELQAAIEADDGATGSATGGHVHGPDCHHDHDHDHDHAKSSPRKAAKSEVPAEEAASTKKPASKKAKPAAEAAAADSDADPVEVAKPKKAAAKKVADKAEG